MTVRFTNCFCFLHIEILYLGNNKLKGRLPASLVQLTALSDLRISNNTITGTIPEELKKMYALGKDKKQ